GDTITNLGAPQADGDAINLDYFNENRSHYYSVNDSGTQQDNYANDGAEGVDSLAAGVAAATGAGAERALALGYNTSATGVDSVAIGQFASAEAGGSVAIGRDATANGGQAISIGYGNTATGDGAVSIGDPSTAIGDGALALGKDNYAEGTGAVTVGNNNTSEGDGALAIGDTNIANGNGSITMGVNNLATGNGAVAMGNDNVVTGDGAFAVGNDATSGAIDSLALGTEASATSQHAMALGNSSDASGFGAFAVGNTSVASGGGAMAVGQISTATGLRSSAIGLEAIASAEDALAVGTEAEASGLRSTTLGNNSVAAGQGSSALGSNADAQAFGSMAVGARSTAVHEQSIALGGASRTVRGAQDNYAAYGLDAPQTSKGELAIGQVAVFDEDGNQLTEPGERQITGVAAGSADTDAVNVSQLKGIETHYYSVNDGGTQAGNYDNDGATGDNALAAGANASASADNGVALGNGATARTADSVALGGGAITNDAVATDSATIGGTSYAFAGTSPVGTVSIGSAGNERTITNVAAGRVADDSTDAVNGSQLFATNEAVDSATDIANNANQGFDLSAQDGGASTVAPGSEVNLRNTDDNVEVTQTTANGREEVNFDLADDVTIGNSLTVNNGPTIDGDGIDMGGDVISNVGDGTAPGDAVNRGQLDGISDGLTMEGLNFSGNQGDDVHRDLGQTLAITGEATAGGDYSGSNLQTVTDPATGTISIQMTDQPQFGDVTVNADGDGTISGVADGADPGDAVNVSQLSDVSEVANAGWNLSTNDGPATNIAPDGEVNLRNTDGNVTVSQTTANGREEVNFDLADDVTVGNSLTVTDGPTIDGDGIDMGGDTISNVGAPQADGDAINREYFDANRSHYYSVNDGGTQAGNYDNDGATGDNALAAGVNASASAENGVALGNGANARTADSVALGGGAITNDAVATDSATIGSTNYDFAGATPIGTVSIGSVGNERTITNVAAGRVTDDSTDAVNGSQLFATNEAVDSATDIANNANQGWNLQTNGDTASQIEPGDTVQFIDGQNIALTRNGPDVTVATTPDLAADSLTINNGGPTIDGGGIDMGGQTISNVGAPENDGDVVNREYFDANSSHYYSINDGGTQDDNYDNNGATGVNSLAAGVDASATAENGVAVGYGANSTAVGSVALGAGSIASREPIGAQGEIDTNGDTTIRYNTNDQTLLGAVSVGDPGTGNDDGSYRQITNVADGIQSQDAVTIRQLRGAIGSVEQTSTFYFHANSPVDPADNDSLAVGENSIAVGPNTVVNADNGLGIGNGAQVAQGADGATAIGMNSQAGLEDAVAIGTESSANGEQSLALGAGAEAGNPQSVALGSNSVTDDVVATEETTINGTTYGFAGTDPTGTVSVGGTKTDGDGNTITQTRTVTNVAAGRVDADSTDAINGSQLYTTNQVLEGVSGDIDDIAGDTSDEYAETNGRGIRYVRTNETGLDETDAFAQAPGGTAVGYQARASAENAVALGRNAVASEAGSVALGQNATTAAAVGTDSGTIAGQEYAYAGTSPVATVSVGAPGSERTITNVAAGRVNADSTDAINGSQLYATNQAVDNIDGRVNAVQGDVNELDGRVTNVEGDVANLGDSVDDLDDRAVQYDTDANGDPDYDSITLAGDDGTTIGNVAAGDISQDSMDAVNGGQLWAVQNEITDINEGGIKYFKANSEGAAAQADGQDSVAMGPDSVAEGDRSTAIGAGSRSEVDDGVALGSGSVASREGMNGDRERFSDTAVASNRGAVSVGSEGGERQITHVAGGTEATDAANIRQLEAVQMGAVNYDRNEDGTVDYGSVTLGNGDSPTRLRNVSAGVADTDAANVGQLRSLDRNYNRRFRELGNEINDVEDTANAGAASAIAIGSLPKAYLPGKSMFTAGAGTYNGESALAMGVSSLSDNGRYSVNVNVTGDSQDNFGAGVGAGVYW
ncbi:YadA-like family protein, partial [Salinisphaera orenii]